MAPHSPVQVNGVVLTPKSAGGHVEIDATTMRLRVSGGVPTQVAVRMKPPTGIGRRLSGSLDWNIAKAGIIGDLAVSGIGASHPFFGLPVVREQSSD